MENPASFFIPTLMFSVNMMEAARQCNVERYLFTSSIGVYEPKDIFNEDDVWSSFPSENDRFAGWAKRIGELQAQAYEIQYGWDKISIVRPANCKKIQHLRKCQSNHDEVHTSSSQG